ncbi:hypothetical protein L6R49_05985 [Myxococcota bacterium]|nr:hypothetical protein [Myxococcota bacterium]
MTPRLLPLTLIVCWGCGDGVRGTSDGLLTADYNGLVDGATWTWRDDVSTDELPDEAELLRGRYVGEGVIEIRRGERFADAEPWGFLEFDTSEGLALVAWELGEVTGEGRTPLSGDRILDDQLNVSGRAQCVGQTYMTHDTFYATYDAAVRFDCAGGGLPGVYIFSKGVGLVALRTNSVTLDLVAPW